jgi:hypothetical protein
MSKLFNQWIARLDAWEARVTDFPNYPGWLSVFAGVTFAVAGASLILALGFLILISLVPGLSTLIQPLQPLGEVLAAIVAGLMILAIILFLLFVLHTFLVLITYALISLTRGTLKSLLALAHILLT